MVFFLGIIDIVAAVLLLSKGIHPPFLIVVAIFLFAKAFICLTDIGSLIDIGAAILLILNILTVPPPLLLLIMAILLGIKGLMSFFAF